MNIRRKTIVLMSVIIIASFLLGSTLVAAAPEGTGLDALWDAIFGIEEDVEDLQEQVDLQEQIAELQSEVDVLKAQMKFLEDPWIQGPPGQQGETGPQGEQGPEGLQGVQGPPGGFGAPDHDSGWIAISKGGTQYVSHNLGTTNIFAYLVGRRWDSINGIWEIHQKFFGGELFGTTESGLIWLCMDDNSIFVRRLNDDWSAGWEEFRAYIWVIL